MDTMKDTTMQPATDVVIVPEATAEFIAGLLARIERLEADLATAEQDSRQKQARIDRLEGEESKQAALLDCLKEWKELAKSAEKERDALRAKIEAMGRQEPTHWACKVLQADASWKEEVSSEVPPSGYFCVRDIKPLYALPGAQAQPASSVPEVTDAMALAFHHALTDGSIGAREVEEIKDALRAALAAAAAAPEAKP